MKRSSFTSAVSFVAAISAPALAFAQSNTQADTSRSQRLNAVVITPDRAPGSIANATAAVSRIDATTFTAQPVRSVPDALRYAPGLAFLDFDGLGHDPQLLVRGFYGGGEAEYAVLLLNGRPLNALDNGRATWDMVPLSAIETIEVVRGGSSAAWGDAAIGGVINLITREPESTRTRGTLSIGNFGEVLGSISTGALLGDMPLALFGNAERSAGFRDHAERTTGGLGATLDVVSTDRTSIALRTLHNLRDVEDPGALGSDMLATSREASSPFSRFDNNRENMHRLGIDVGAGAFRGYVDAEYRDSDRIRTLVLAPEFADTKDRSLNAARVQLNAQLELKDLLFAGDDELVFGIDASLGKLRSRYYDFAQGSMDDYRATAGERGSLHATSESARTALAGFFSYGVQPSEAVRFSLGARFDWLRDTATTTQNPYVEHHAAFSPKFGINVRYTEGAGGSNGHLYANIGRSFKAPTQEQLFDPRATPVPFDPFQIVLSFNGLNPQFGTTYEVGIRQGMALSRTLFADLTMSGYQMDMKDEIDFSFEAFGYRNIGRSRHRGLESSVSLQTTSGVGVFANYTIQAATSRSGESFGNYLKAIPRNMLVGGASYAAHGASVSATVTNASGIWLDDANSIELPAWTRVDMRLSQQLAGVRVFGDVINLLDREYSTTAFPDPAGSDLMYHYPAAGRVLRIGISRDW